MLVLSLLLPLLCVASLLLGQSLARWLLLLMPLPALWLVAFPSQWQIPIMLTGLHLGVDGPGRPLLLLATLLWLASGIYAHAYIPAQQQRRFGLFWALTWIGTLGTLIALDVVSFYLFFTWMSLSAYGLIVHSGDPAAQRAARIYLIMAMLGEALILPALMLLVANGDNSVADIPARLAVHPWQPLISTLLVAGFGIKLGILPLHVWLPLAHPAAPTPASAVLSGVLIKLGLLAWLRFLPLGELALPGWSSAFLCLGFAAALYGVVVGIGQQHPKTVLAYSSISQMGLLIGLLGIALNAPLHWPVIELVIVIFALHHGLAKAALFLGQGVLSRGADRAALALLLPALTLAGAPMSSGALAKSFYKQLAPLAPDRWPTLLGPMLWVSSAATTLLLLRFLYLCWPTNREAQAVPLSMWLPWVLLALAGVWLPWYWSTHWLPEFSAQVLTDASAMTLLFPLIAGSLLALLAHRWQWPPRLPSGDILALGRYVPRLKGGHLPRLYISASPDLRHTLQHIKELPRVLERRLRRWANAGVLFLLLVGVLVWLNL